MPSARTGSFSSQANTISIGNGSLVTASNDEAAPPDAQNQQSGQNTGSNLEEKDPFRPKVPYHFPPKHKGNPWQDLITRIKTYDEDLCRGWREDIDTLLVFAGLFSAAVTAFVIESYQWLREDSGETTAAVISAIYRQMTDPNATVATFENFHPSSSSIRINVYWFLSLTLSLAAVLIGTLCKQWMREYLRDAAVHPQKDFELRQLRYQSWEKWRVPTIIAMLPMLLQLALILFFVGVLELLWTLNSIVAAIITASFGLVLVFVIVTTVLPVYYYYFRIIYRDLEKRDDNNLFPCPYRSPVSFLVFDIVCRHARIFTAAPDHLLSFSTWVSYDLSLLAYKFKRTAKQSFSLSPHDYLRRGFRWTLETLGDNVEVVRILFHCMHTCKTPYDKPELLPLSSYVARQDIKESASKELAYCQLLRPYQNYRDIADFRLEMVLRDACARLKAGLDITPTHWTALGEVRRRSSPRMLRKGIVNFFREFNRSGSDDRAEPTPPPLPPSGPPPSSSPPSSNDHDQPVPSFQLRNIIVEDRPVAAGGFSDIYIGRMGATTVCIKVLRMHGTDQIEKISSALSREAQIWKDLRHPNVIPLLGVSTDLFAPRKTFSLVIPWMDNGTVINYLHLHPEQDRMIFARQIAFGMQYLHERQVVHGDIRGANVLVSSDIRCCLTDFGLSTVLDSTAPFTQSSGVQGSLRWMAPETFEDMFVPMSKARDIYAFGCTILEICTGLPPFHLVHPEARVILEVVSGRRPQRPSQNAWVTDSLWSLIERCWSQDPHERPTASVVVQLLHDTIELNPAVLEEELYRLRVRPSAVSRDTAARTWSADRESIHSRSLLSLESGGGIVASSSRHAEQEFIQANSDPGLRSEEELATSALSGAEILEPSDPMSRQTSRNSIDALSEPGQPSSNQER